MRRAPPAAATTSMFPLLALLACCGGPPGDGKTDAAVPLFREGATTCDDGGCAPAPAVVKASPATSCEVALVGTTVFWTDRDHGFVESIDLGGQPPATLLAFGRVNTEVAPHAIVARDKGVYWLAGLGSALHGETGLMPPRTLAAPGPGIAGLTASPDGTTVYFSTGTTIQQIDATANAAAPVVVAMEAENPTALALDGDTLVALLPGKGVDVITLSPGVVAHCGDGDPAAGAPVYTHCGRLATLGATAIAAAGGRAYWLDGDLVGTNDLATGTSAKTLAIFNAPLVAIAAANGSVYVATGTRILKLDPTGAAPVIVVAATPDPPVSMAVDSAGVFWTTPDCRILAARP